MLWPNHKHWIGRISALERHNGSYVIHELYGEWHIVFTQLQPFCSTIKTIRTSEKASAFPRFSGIVFAVCVYNSICGYVITAYEIRRIFINKKFERIDGVRGWLGGNVGVTFFVPSSNDTIIYSTQYAFYSAP